MHDTTVRRTPAAETGLRRRLPTGESLIWLVAVAVLFFLAELAPPLLRLPLGADEITYIARTSAHASGVALPPVHGHGAGLLAAPVTLLTTSLTAIRVWMAVLSALALFLGMLCWRGLRPAWLLALAGLILGSLAITQMSGVQVYPDWWAAVAILALTGLFLQYVNGRGRPGVVLTLIGACAFLIVLMRPQNIVFILAPVIAAALAVPAWRKPKVLIAIGVGILLGCANWAGEAYIWYGGLGNRIHLAGQEPPKFKLYLSFFYQMRVLSGPWYCLPHQCHNWNFPWFTLWWVALVALSVLGVIVTWRTSRKASAVLAAATGLWVAVLYSLLVPFGAPRYLLPTYALGAILAADAIEWLVTKPRWRAAGAVIACLFLVSGIVSQHLVLDRMASNQTYSRSLFVENASELRKLGVHPPCVVESPSAAYYVGCAAPWTGIRVPAFLQLRTMGGLDKWKKVYLPGGHVVFVPASPQHSRR